MYDLNPEQAVLVLEEFFDTASPSLFDHSRLQAAVEVLLPTLRQQHLRKATVTLLSCGPTKIQVIKAIRGWGAVRQWTRLGLKEAKEITDMVPTEIQFISREHAENFVKEAKDLGAQVSYVFADPPVKESLTNIDALAMFAGDLVTEVRGINASLKGLLDQHKKGRY